MDHGQVLHICLLVKMHFCVYLLMVLSVTLSLAKEKRFSEESSDKSSNNPFMWMMMRQLDRTATRLDKVHSLRNQNHIAINNIKGMLEKDEVKANEPKFKILEDCCKKQKKQITSLESNVLTQGRECRNIEKNATSFMNEFQINMKGMQSKIKRAIEPKIQSLEDLCKKQKKQIKSLESNVITQGRVYRSFEKKATSLLNEFQRNMKGMQSKIEKAIEPKIQSLEDLCKKQKTHITSLESNAITQGREYRSFEKKATSLLNGFQRNMKSMQSEIDDLKKRSSTCPEEWMFFSGHCYWLEYQKTTWHNAKNICQEKGGYLAKVESGAENSWLLTHVKGELWIGLNDIQREGHWRWVSDNTGISYRYWSSSQPDGRRVENCVHYCKERCNWKSYIWNDNICGSHIGYICEKSL